MKKALVIFNGIRFPFYVVDHAIAWAKKNSASIQALFLKSEDEVKEGYVFPSDLDAAENLSDAEDTEKGNIHVIQSQMKTLKDMAATENITTDTELLTEPPLEEILATAKNCSILFIDADYNETTTLAVTNFDLDDLIDKSPCPVEPVSADA